VKGEDGELPISLPRDRGDGFQPEIIKKGQTRINGMDEKNTDAVLDEVRKWQSRALERMYLIVIFDALRVKIRDVPYHAYEYALPGSPGEGTCDD